MKLLFKGHDARYAVEQSLLAFFPQERPVYDPAAREENQATVTLSQGKKYITAVTTLCYDGCTKRGISRVLWDPSADAYAAERLRQRAVKLSFFKAARQVTGVTPSWGALTGIRPAKLAAGYLEQGMTPRQVDRLLRDTYCVSQTRRELCIEAAQAGLKAKSELHPEDISLYIGIPFCPTRCAYCSFVSQAVEKSFGLMEPYLEVLLGEITRAAQMVEDLGLHIKSFYMGGGTPTTLSAGQMDRLLTHLNRSFDLSHCAEYCIEAGRPDTIDREKLRVLMDLIAGLPADTPEGFRRTLDKCLSFGADNITVHTLALKKGSRILLEGQKIPSAEAVGQMLDYSVSALRGADFHPYYLYRQKYMSGSFENIGWCISGAEGLYNIYIMEELHSILSLGAGGSTKMVDPAAGHIERVFHAKYPNEYITRPEKIQKNLEDFADFYRRMKK